MQNMRRVMPVRPVRADMGMSRSADATPPACSRMQDKEQDGCKETMDCLSGVPSLAMVYVPCMRFQEIYDDAEALKNGTLFRTLTKPFRPGYRGKGGEA